MNPERERQIRRAWEERRRDFPPGVDKIRIPLRPRDEARPIDRLLALPEEDVQFVFQRRRGTFDGKRAELITCEGVTVQMRPVEG